MRTWYDIRKDSSAKERTVTALNRLSVFAVPVKRTRFFWHNTIVRTGNKDISLTLTVGVDFNGKTISLPMHFRNQGDEVVYCSPNESVALDLDLLKYAASLSVELLYPMSGLETEEAILQPGRIDVLLGQGQTAQVLRNLCLIVAVDSPEDWKRIVALMRRLSGVVLQDPKETPRGAIEVHYTQPGVRDALDVSSSGRGFQQMLLIFSYLYSHKRSVLLIDEPDAHLEILRQKQVYVLLRDIASENQSQVVMVTHSEVISDEALDKNLTLLIEGKADNLARKTEISNSLRHFGAEHYVKARERGYVFYVEGGTDVDMLRAFAERLNHPVFTDWDERINSFYVQNNYPGITPESELERVEGGFGITPLRHFSGLNDLLPDLRGLAILDNDGHNRQDSEKGRLNIVYWRRYEAENYFITPDVLKRYALAQYITLELFNGFEPEIDEVLDGLVLERVFDSMVVDFAAWKRLPPELARLVWDTKTQNLKLNTFAEDFFRQLSRRVSGGMLLTKREFHRLMGFVDAKNINAEVGDKLNLLHRLFLSAAASVKN